MNFDCESEWNEITETLASVTDKDFMKGIKSFYNDNQMQFATKDTLVLAFENASNMPLQSFFDSWIDGKIVITSN